MLSSNDFKNVLGDADCLYTQKEVENALDNMASEINKKLKDKNPVIICVLTGAIIPMGHILTRLSFPLQIDYIHATRYENGISGRNVKWLSEPNIDIKNRNVLIIDDIFDEGLTLQEIIKYCKQRKVKSVETAVLVNKVHDRKVDLSPDIIGLNVEDRYLFGYGMDYKSYFRNVAGIYAVKGL